MPLLYNVYNIYNIWCDIMQREQIKNVLKKVEHGELSADDALDLIRLQPYKELSFANVDTARSLRNGVGEVIYGRRANCINCIGSF